jgi:hypothetical protein
MADDKNRLRNQVVNDVSAGLAQSLRSDRRGLVILLLQVTNAVWFATLWEHDFRPVAAAVIWAAFFAASVAVAIAIEKRRPAA